VPQLKQPLILEINGNALEMDQWLDNRVLDRCRTVFEAAGITI